MDPRRQLLLGLAGMALAACWRATPEPAPFTVARVSPALAVDAPPLLLNDAITVYFSADVLPVSVTHTSVTLVDEHDQAVPGSLRVGANWVTFQPAAPVTPGLLDGSFRPGASYRLMLAGVPRPDAVRAADGRRLAAATVLPVRIARPDEKPAALPALLRPLANDIPFLLRTPEGLQQLPADAPRLQLHFTQPLLPASVTPEAFDVTLLSRPPGVRLAPRSVRVLSRVGGSRSLDEPAGASIEIDLGALPARADGSAPEPLRAGDLLCVQLRLGDVAVRDYAGQAPLPRDAVLWSVVAGANLTLAGWPAPGDAIESRSGLAPSFEAFGDGLRPRVRLEAGDGSLGIFRPNRDTTLRPGEPFDRGDGLTVVSRGPEFPFLAVDIPPGVTVRIAADAGPVQVLCCGSVRIAGDLVVAATPQPAPPGRAAATPVRDLAAQVPVALIAAGDILVAGAVRSSAAANEQTTGLLLASAATIDLSAAREPLPFQASLAVEVGPGGVGGGLRGPRGQTRLYLTTFTYGVATGADFEVDALVPWRQLPWDREAAVVRFVETLPGIQVQWQATPADPVHRTVPDLGVGRISRLLPVGQGDTVGAGPGAFVRLALLARVRSAEVPPALRDLRLCDR